jgi:hypothetical protein
VTDEDLVFDDHPLTEEGVRGYLAARTNNDTALDLNEWANYSFVPNFATIKVDKVRVKNLYVFP